MYSKMSIGIEVVIFTSHFISRRSPRSTINSSRITGHPEKEIVEIKKKREVSNHLIVGISKIQLFSTQKYNTTLVLLQVVKLQDYNKSENEKRNHPKSFEKEIIGVQGRASQDHLNFGCEKLKKEDFLKRRDPLHSQTNTAFPFPAHDRTVFQKWRASHENTIFHKLITAQQILLMN